MQGDSQPQHLGPPRQNRRIAIGDDAFAKRAVGEAPQENLRPNATCVSHRDGNGFHATACQ